MGRVLLVLPQNVVGEKPNASEAGAQGIEAAK
jgi:hypothetical protein